MVARTDASSARSAAEELRAAFSASQLTQTAFAAALGTSQPRLSTYLSGRVSPSADFFVRARTVGRALEDLAALCLLSAPTLSAALRSALSRNDEDWAFRLLMQARDHLSFVLTQHPDLRAGWIASPLPAGRVEWDTLMAGVVGHEFSRASREPPTWTRCAPLAVAWDFPSALLTPHEVRAATPDWLASLNVFVPERNLATA